MADTSSEAVPLKQEEAVGQQTKVGAEETDMNVKTVDALSPRKRDRPPIEENDLTGISAKRVKGVAPIKTE